MPNAALSTAPITQMAPKQFPQQRLDLNIARSPSRLVMQASKAAALSKKTGSNFSARIFQKHKSTTPLNAKPLSNNTTKKVGIAAGTALGVTTLAGSAFYIYKNPEKLSELFLNLPSFPELGHTFSGLFTGLTARKPADSWHILETKQGIEFYNGKNHVTVNLPSQKRGFGKNLLSTGLGTFLGGGILLGMHEGHRALTNADMLPRPLQLPLREADVWVTNNLLGVEIQNDPLRDTLGRVLSEEGLASEIG